MITTPVYCTREDVKRSLDILVTARENWRVDRAVQSAARNIDHRMHRRFYPEIRTNYWDWPSYQYAYPWRIWFDASELADTTVNVPVVTTGGTVIPASQIFWGPWNYAPPYTYMELDRSTSAAFGAGDTPQRDVSIAGTYGYNVETDPAGTLAVALSDTTGTTVVVSDAALVGVGALLVADTERMIVADKAMSDTTVPFTGPVTDSAADNVLTVPDGTQFAVDEVILLDAERMLIVDITSNNLTVKRAWDGTVLATHTSGTIYAARQLTVIRGSLGTTAATHTEGDVLAVHRPPFLVRDLNIAEAGQRVLQEVGGYTNPQGEAQLHGLGTALADLWDETETAYGRKARQRVI